MPVSGCVCSLNACVCLVYNHLMCHASVWMCLFIECLRVFSLQQFDVSCPCLDVCSLNACVCLVYNHCTCMDVFDH